MRDDSQLPQTTDLPDLPDVLVVWGSPAALAGVIELDPDSDVLIATRSGQSSGFPAGRIVTTSPSEALSFVSGRSGAGDDEAVSTFISSPTGTTCPDS